MTVSIGTGHTEYYPLYISLGNVHNNIRHSHSSAVSILAFLAIPKSMYSYFTYSCFTIFQAYANVLWLDS